MKKWEYAHLSYEDGRKLSVEDCSSMLKYVDMLARFSNGSGTWLYFLFFVSTSSFLRAHEFVAVTSMTRVFFSAYEVSCMFSRRIKL